MIAAVQAALAHRVLARDLDPSPFLRPPSPFADTSPKYPSPASHPRSPSHASTQHQGPFVCSIDTAESELSLAPAAHGRQSDRSHLHSSAVSPYRELSRLPAETDTVSVQHTSSEVSSGVGAAPQVAMGVPDTIPELGHPPSEEPVPLRQLIGGGQPELSTLYCALASPAGAQMPLIKSHRRCSDSAAGQRQRQRRKRASGSGSSTSGTYVPPPPMQRRASDGVVKAARPRSSSPQKRIGTYSRSASVPAMHGARTCPPFLRRLCCVAAVTYLAVHRGSVRACPKRWDVRMSSRSAPVQGRTRGTSRCSAACPRATSGPR
jgi:hypothetical protein